MFDSVEITCSRDMHSIDPNATTDENDRTGNTTIGCVRVGKILPMKTLLLVLIFKINATLLNCWELLKPLTTKA